MVLSSSENRKQGDELARVGSRWRVRLDGGEAAWWGGCCCRPAAKDVGRVPSSEGCWCCARAPGSSVILGTEWGSQTKAEWVGGEPRSQGTNPQGLRP